MQNKGAIDIDIANKKMIGFEAGNNSEIEMKAVMDSTNQKKETGCFNFQSKKHKSKSIKDELNQNLKHMSDKQLKNKVMELHYQNQALVNEVSQLKTAFKEQKEDLENIWSSRFDMMMQQQVAMQNTFLANVKKEFQEQLQEKDTVIQKQAKQLRKQNDIIVLLGDENKQNELELYQYKQGITKPAVIESEIAALQGQNEMYQTRCIELEAKLKEQSEESERAKQQAINEALDEQKAEIMKKDAELKRFATWDHDTEYKALLQETQNMHSEFTRKLNKSYEKQKQYKDISKKYRKQDPDARDQHIKLLEKENKLLRNQLSEREKQCAKLDKELDEKIEHIKTQKQQIDTNKLLAHDLKEAQEKANKFQEIFNAIQPNSIEKIMYVITSALYQGENADQKNKSFPSFILISVLLNAACKMHKAAEKKRECEIDENGSKRWETSVMFRKKMADLFDCNIKFVNSYKDKYKSFKACEHLAESDITNEQIISYILKKNGVNVNSDPAIKKMSEDLKHVNVQDMESEDFLDRSFSEEHDEFGFDSQEENEYRNRPSPKQSRKLSFQEKEDQRRDNKGKEIDFDSMN